MVCDGDALLVVESAGHRLLRLRLPAAVLTAPGAARGCGSRSGRARSPCACGSPRRPEYLDRRFGEPTSLTVSAPGGVLESGAGTAGARADAAGRRPGDGAGRRRGSSVLDGDSDEVGIFAACHRYRQEWDVEVAVVPGGAGAVSWNRRWAPDEPPGAASGLSSSSDELDLSSLGLLLVFFELDFSGSSSPRSSSRSSSSSCSSSSGSFRPRWPRPRSSSWSWTWWSSTPTSSWSSGRRPPARGVTPSPWWWAR